MATVTSDPRALIIKGAKLAELRANAYAKFGGSEKVELIDSGSEILNAVLGDGGIPRGCLIDFTASFGLGKSTSMLFVCKHLCDQGEYVYYLDVESGVNPSQIDGIGLGAHLYHPEDNPDGKFFLANPGNFDEVDQLFELICAIEPKPAVVVLDSITQLQPSKLAGISVENVETALHARLTKNLLQKYKNPFHKAKVTLFLINQVRVKLNFNRPSTVEGAGGYAYKHACDVHLQMKPLKKLERIVKGEKVPYGAEVLVSTLKNRHALPFRSLTMAIIFGKGISNLQAYIEFLKKKGMASLSGSYYTMKVPGIEVKRVNGQAGLENWVKENLDGVREVIRKMGGFTLNDEVISEVENDDVSKLAEDINTVEVEVGDGFDDMDVEIQ